MVKVEKKKNKSGFYDYTPNITISGDLLTKLGLGKTPPRLGEKLRIEGLVEVSHLAKNAMENDNSRTISFEFKEIEIETKSDTEEKFYGKT